MAKLPSRKLASCTSSTQQCLFSYIFSNSGFKNNFNISYFDKDILISF